MRIEIFANIVENAQLDGRVVGECGLCYFFQPSAVFAILTTEYSIDANTKSL